MNFYARRTSYCRQWSYYKQELRRHRRSYEVWICSRGGDAVAKLEFTVDIE